ncbi:MAG: hypothetical protein KAZ85_00710, partial [Gammaproteobacteria bacterium]|nr:hypothetical protein [Gammaproteobacteria bacterium]
PAEANEPMTIDKAMLMASNLTPVITPVVAAPAVTDIKLVCTDVKGQVNQWITAWTSQDVTGYLNQYSPNFSAGGMTHTQWVKLRTHRVSNPAKGITLSIDSVRTSQVGNRMEATFNQVYDNQIYKDQVEKTLVFDNVGGKCRIVEEKVSKGRLY